MKLLSVKKFGDAWAIFHAPTGLTVGSGTWVTRAEAEAVLARCRADYTCWEQARAGNEAAMACRVLFGWACA